ncbi:MAG: hypothetical protein KGZ86_01960 [Candidatus Latescibacteria bacterium]|nr:hypothetical protein [Candidatus Latescibacterota bacterium]
MVATLVAWLYLFLLSWVYGSWLLVFILRVLKYERQEVDIPIPLKVILGFVFLSAAGIWFSLFLPLGWLVNLLFLLGAIFLAWRNWTSYRLDVSRFSASSCHICDFLVFMVLGIIFIFALTGASGKAVNPDTLLYHIQTIRWAETYPAVPGLANLHSRLAFNSSWLSMNALFGFGFLFGQPLRALLGFLLVLSSWYFLTGFSDFVARKSLVGLFRLSLILVLAYVSKSEISSPGTDVPAILFLCLGTALYLDALDRQVVAADVYKIFAIVLACFAVTIKLSVLPVLAIPLLVIIKNFHRREIIILVSLFSLFVFTPWLARNVILSGYLLYPFPQIDIFFFDWKVPAERVEDTRNEVTAFARMPSQPVAYAIQQPFSVWFKEWFRVLTGFRTVLFWAAVFSPVFVGLRYFISTKINKDWLILTLCSYLALLYWFISAPSFRFGIGFIAITLMLVLLLFLEIIPIKPMRILGFLIFAFCLLYPGYLSFMLLQNDNLHSRLVFPTPYESPKTSVCYIDDKLLNCAEIYGWCGYDSFPCAIKIRDDLTLRGEDWAAGFRSNNP